MATKWQSTESFFVPQAIDETSTTQQNPEGLIISARDVGITDYGTGQFIYLPGAASTILSDWVTYDQKTLATTLVASLTTKGKFAVAMSANAATTSWGWYQIQGQAVQTTTLTGNLDNNALFPTATAGAVDNSGTATYVIIGALTNGDVSLTPFKIDVILDHPMVLGQAI